MRRSILILAALSLSTLAVRADDLRLKDGSKISGTIVGFDDNSFKVQTSYGFAMVRKDQVVSISVSDPAKTDAEKTASKPSPDASSNTAPGPLSAKTDSTSSRSSQKIIAPPSPATPSPKPISSVSTVAAPTIPAPSPRGSAASVVPVSDASAAPPKPGPIQEQVNGSTYVNQTYGFRMYKPPDWEVIEGARSLLPGAITAMGTSDDTTYLLIGAAPAGKSLAGDIDATDQRLRGLLDNFRPLGESHLTVSGTQAVERKFRASVDQKDWSGTIVFLSRDGELYTIFGMTLAETDLVQIQENVIAKAISSLRFTQ